MIAREYIIGLMGCLSALCAVALVAYIFGEWLPNRKQRKEWKVEQDRQKREFGI